MLLEVKENTWEHTVVLEFLHLTVDSNLDSDSASDSDSDSKLYWDSNKDLDSDSISFVIQALCEFGITSNLDSYLDSE